MKYLSHFTTAVLLLSSVVVVEGFQPTTITPTAARSCSASTICFASVDQTSTNNNEIPDVSTPLPPHTFAGMVERELLERFEESEIERVLQSWRLLDQDYYHKQYVGDEEGQQDKDDSMMVQECHSYLPGLSIRPFWNTDDFDWATYIKSNYQKIRKEFDSVNTDMQRLQEEGNNVWAGALTEDAAAYGEGWKTLVLMDRGRWATENVKLFPNTAKIVHDSGVPVTEVFFASMSGPSEIKKHTDFSNLVLTSHLALDIPYSGENKCRISVGDETREWINGDLMMFDTSLMHDAVNESDKMRYILMLRLWHPDLTVTERNALQVLYDCLEVPGLVSSDLDEKFRASQMVEAMKAFPSLQSAEARGFGGGGGGKKGGKKKNKGKRAKGKGFGS